MFRLFVVYDVFLVQLVLAFLFLLSFTDAASGAPANATIRFDSPLISFSAGWSLAEFEGAGTEDQFAFANKDGEQLVVQLPRNVSAVFYQGFKSNGGALWFACLDCDPSQDAGGNVLEVDAHDDTENGTQPPEILFSFTNVDPTQLHVLTVVNLEDARFNNTSQITFDALILTIDGVDGGQSPSTTTTSSTSVTGGSIPTITVTAHGPHSTVAAPTSTGTTDTSSTGTSSGSQAATTTTDGSNGGGAPTTSTGATSSDQGTQPTGTGATSSGQGTQPTSSPSGVTTTSSDGSQGSSTSDSNSPSGSQTQTQNPTSTGASGTSPTGTGSQTGTGTSGSPTGSESPQPTAGPDTGSSGTGASGTGSSGRATSTSSGAPGNGSSNNSSSTNPGVSKTVIIVVAVIASLFVLALLAAITWLLVRNHQPPPSTDPEGSAGLMREAAPVSIVSGPVGLAPMRPVNPFVDTVPSNMPLDDGPFGDPASESPPRIGLPPIPPRSPLRATYSSSPTRPAWLTRTPRTPSPTSDE
ncbi:hypothetical protein BD310DRAFT_291803 [Dichomitus squalens]|uniref:Uncharacterized protein n=1 Tax=Dichomitus squalens TaxID=114155 RepID=A0A4Q9QC82_9APHY|nr:hypothetical protein BD310DRAFT_291803 [Dichomitus squalens]